LDLWATLNITWQGLWLILTILVVRAHTSIALVSLAFAAAALVASVTAWPWLRRLVQQTDEHAAISPYSMKSVIASSANLGVGALLITVLVWTDTIIVRSVAGQRAAGVYAAGNRIALALVMLASFYVLGAFPKLSQSAMISVQEFSKYFDRVYEDLALLFIPGSVWAFARAPQIMLLVFKRPEYLAGVGVFRIFQVFLLVCVLSNLYGMGVLVTHHRDHAYRRALLISAVAMLVLCSLLTVRWGPGGAAIAVLLGQVLSLVLFMAETRDIVRVGHLKILALPALVGLVPVLGGMILHVGFWISVVLLVLTYVVIAVWRHPALYPAAR
jgi:O-antigen/teichoic acid export membrane protein